MLESRKPCISCTFPLKDFFSKTLSLADELRSDKNNKSEDFPRRSRRTEQKHCSTQHWLLVKGSPRQRRCWAGDLESMLFSDWDFLRAIWWWFVNQCCETFATDECRVSLRVVPVIAIFSCIFDRIYYIWKKRISFSLRTPLCFAYLLRREFVPEIPAMSSRHVMTWSII